jgi:hypothetical protein
MTSPAPVIVQPDLEAWVWANISDLGGLHSFEYSATQNWPGWIYSHFIQVDARTKRKAATRDLAEQVRQIICALPDVPWTEGVVCYVEPVEGPFWLPDPDGSPRYATRYEIRVHPHRTPGALKAARPAHPPRQTAASPEEP